jgi:ATP-dependent RNA helicase DeaD
MSNNTETSAPQTGFKDFNLITPLLKSLQDVGYEIPSPIQAQSIPHLMAGKDLLGQAQTGTGKTAAFALPILSRLDLKQFSTQTLVLAPTRELAIQVAEAFKKYAAHMRTFQVLPVYGGADMSHQLRQLKRGVHVVVGTPGRVMDHMRRGSLKLDNLSSLVLDEADEMLNMGFLEDIEWILEQTPESRQIALFSATMPPAIRKIARRYLNAPEEISVKAKTTTADTIKQHFCIVPARQKLDLLTRILEAEDFEATLIFVRTKIATVELANKLNARGYNCSALNGDIAQRSREKIIEQLKSGKTDIVVATDVAARGLDVEKISHVINFDIPSDTESYVHRVGRTGRAGRDGDAILFVTPREKNMLNMIERATKKRIEPLKLPTPEEIQDKRAGKLKSEIQNILAKDDLKDQRNFVKLCQHDCVISTSDIAAALLKLVQIDPSLFTKNSPQKDEKLDFVTDSFEGSRDRRQPRNSREGGRKDFISSSELDTYSIQVGSTHGAQAGNIVGAISNEASLDSKFIGKVRIFDEYSTVELPKGMPADTFNILKNIWLFDQKFDIELKGGAARDSRGSSRGDRGSSRGDRGNSARPSRPKRQKRKSPKNTKK